MAPRPRTGPDDTAIRVGPAGGAPAAGGRRAAMRDGTLEHDVAAAMTAAMLVVTMGADHRSVVIYRKALDKLTTRLPNITRELAAAEVGRFVRGYTITGEQNMNRAAAHCAARIITIDRFTLRTKETSE